MKKNMSLIYLDSEFIDWLCDRLIREAPECVCAGELLCGIRDLSEGIIENVLLGTAGNEQAFDGFNDDTLCIRNLVIYPKRRKVLLGKVKIDLTPTEFDILYFLARNRGVVFSKEQIYRAVWGEGVLFTDSNIMAFIRKLRKKIEPDPDKPEYILTVWGSGYKITDLP
ncbi:winged helix-turn-helix domain-containing protein [Treponema brennaborense]|uniref:winged helix-turn-helix domain-containing protein n=1 Tax=Treponema brennaborense TaxID=81028 RepID=UPI0002E6ABAC|nr:winged helix-turn-helix domain-containing protein [Treponema brennaborense]